jgi:hypothetical protein
MPTLDDEIRSKTEAFASDLAVLVRQAALEAVGAALGGGATMAAPVQVAAKRGRGRPRKSAAPAPAAQVPAAATPGKAVSESKAPVSKKPTAPKRSSGEKRPPAELAKLTEKLDDYIKAHPGLRMEVIAKAIGTPPRELHFPATKLIAAKKIRAEGQKRATQYFPV